MTDTFANPVTEPEVAVNDLVPAVFSVTGTEMTPASPTVNATGAGRIAWGSLEVKAAVPVKPVATFPKPSFAVIVALKLEPAPCGEPALTVKTAAAA